MCIRDRNREIAQTILEMRGLKVDTAENGKLAVEKFNRSVPGTYQAILMDIRMPVMDGLCATKELSLIHIFPCIAGNQTKRNAKDYRPFLNIMAADEQL